MFSKSDPIINIAFDPTKLIFVNSSKGKVASISLIENNTKYVYLEMQNKTFLTVQMPIK